MALQHLAPVCQAAPVSLLTVARDASASPICGPGGVSSCSGHTVEAIPDALPAAAASRKEARPSSLGPTQSLLIAPARGSQSPEGGVRGLLSSGNPEWTPGGQCWPPPRPPAAPNTEGNTPARHGPADRWGQRSARGSSPRITELLTSETFQSSGVLPRPPGGHPRRYPYAPVLSLEGSAGEWAALWGDQSLDGRVWGAGHPFASQTSAGRVPSARVQPWRHREMQVWATGAAAGAGLRQAQGPGRGTASKGVGPAHPAAGPGPAPSPPGTCIHGLCKTSQTGQAVQSLTTERTRSLGSQTRRAGRPFTLTCS